LEEIRNASLPLEKIKIVTLPSEEINRSVLMAEVEKLSQIPERSNWSEDDKARFESLYPESLGDFKTPEYADFLIASMACGPDPLQPISFTQKLKSLSWFPWEAISHLAPSIFSTWQTITPNSPIVETYPGTHFRYIPPRITDGDPETVCDERSLIPLPERLKNTPHSKEMPELYYRQLKVGNKSYLNLIEYIFRNAKEEIIKPSEPIDFFADWHRKHSIAPVYDENQGVWPVVKKNYENLMKYHFFPALKDTSMQTACPTGGLQCARTEDIYLRPNGIVYSAINEIYTYLRTLRKIVLRLDELTQKSPNDSGAAALHLFVQGELSKDWDEHGRSLIYNLLDRASKPESFDFEQANDHIVAMQLGLFKAIPENEEGLAAMQLINSIFTKMQDVVIELEGYKRFSQLTFQKGEVKGPSQNQPNTGSAYDPRMKVPSSR
jgi:hypothetical protein